MYFLPLWPPTFPESSSLFGTHILRHEQNLAAGGQGRAVAGGDGVSMGAEAQSAGQIPQHLTPAKLTLVRSCLFPVSVWKVSEAEMLAEWPDCRARR